MEGELRILSNLACAASNVSIFIRVLSYALTADKHLAPSLATPVQQIGHRPFKRKIILLSGNY
jgi:hypothetical protein